MCSMCIKILNGIFGSCDYQSRDQLNWTLSHMHTSNSRCIFVINYSQNLMNFKCNYVDINTSFLAEKKLSQLYFVSKLKSRELQIAYMYINIHVIPHKLSRMS